MFFQCSQHSFIPTLCSVPIICPSSVDINSTIHVSCHSATQINTQIGNQHHCNNGYITGMIKFGQGSVAGIATALWAGRSGDQIPVGARFSAPVQTGPGIHPASCTMGTGSFPGVNSSQGVTLTPHPLLVPWSWKSKAMPLLPLLAIRPVQSLSACTRVTFTFYDKIY